MTIECQETRFGRPVGEPRPVEPETSEWLKISMVYRTAIGQALRVDDPDRVTVTLASSLGLAIPIVYTREQINEQKLQTSPLLRFSDFVLWRRRHYSWVEDK